MAMSVGGDHRSPKAEMNVTPMVDILLVLLVIFMLVQTKPPNGMNAQIPMPANDHNKPQRDEATIVLQVRSVKGEAPALFINHESVSWEQLQSRLHDIYKMRADKTMFIQGDKDVEFSHVAHVLDIARATQMSIAIGLMTQSAQGD